jgi:hypothetical protein
MRHTLIIRAQRNYRRYHSSLYCPQDRGCGHVPNALRANRAVSIAPRTGVANTCQTHFGQVTIVDRCASYVIAVYRVVVDSCPREISL